MLQPWAAGRSEEAFRASVSNFWGGALRQTPLPAAKPNAGATCARGPGLRCWRPLEEAGSDGTVPMTMSRCYKSLNA